MKEKESKPAECEWCGQPARTIVSYKYGRTTFWLHQKCLKVMFGNINEANDPFDNAYYLLENEGGCDAAGSCQYRRIKRIWISRKRPIGNITDFIYQNANEAP